jgi:hypothetical protein
MVVLLFVKSGVCTCSESGICEIDCFFFVLC